MVDFFLLNIYTFQSKLKIYYIIYYMGKNVFTFTETEKVGFSRITKTYFSFWVLIHEIIYNYGKERQMQLVTIYVKESS